MNSPALPSIAFATERTGAANRLDERGMRPMQARVWARRGEQYLLIKSPPASGKSRALMFVALDKLANQGVKKAIVVVPERAIGASFADAALTPGGFFADWKVEPRWNLTNAPGPDSARSKVQAVAAFLASDDKALVCTHATFRFAFDELGVAAFDDCLIAVDEFHHVSAHPDSRLGAQVAALIAREKAHIVAMTGSYFRGDAVAVLAPADEARFATVTYTYYEQLNGYDHLKSLRIAYHFYAGRYLDAITAVLDPDLKTIVHIPSVNSRESLKDKIAEAEGIMEALGEWKGAEPETGFLLIERPDGRLLKVADLVDDDAARRDRVVAALKDPRTNAERDRVDVILALGMAKEGFDWIWCEHVLTVGYRASLTEVVQIVGRATRDAPGKAVARFTNLIAEVDASEEAVTEAINDTLKAIAASLLMEQVLAPRFDFTPKNAGAKAGFDYGPDGYRDGATNLGVDQAGRVHLEINGLVQPRSEAARRICAEDLNELIAQVAQDRPTLERGLFQAPDAIPEEITQLRIGKIVRDRYPELTPEDQEAVRQHAVAALNVVQQARGYAAQGSGEGGANTALIEAVRRYVTDVKELDIDLIDRINPFQTAYAILAKSMDESALRQVHAALAARNVAIPEDEARELARRAHRFLRERGRAPDILAQDPWEKRMAEGVVALARHFAARQAGERDDG